MKERLRESFEEVDRALQKIRKAMSEACGEQEKELALRALVLAWDRKEVHYKLRTQNREWVRGLTLS
jgi:hypothetical protein